MWEEPVVDVTHDRPFERALHVEWEIEREIIARRVSRPLREKRDGQAFEILRLVFWRGRKRGKI